MQGNIKNINLLIGDISAQPLPGLPKEATASLFANAKNDASREDIACGAVGSVVAKVSTLVSRKTPSGSYFLTGGFCDSPLLVKKLTEALGAEVKTSPDARFAGAIGAALLGK